MSGDPTFLPARRAEHRCIVDIVWIAIGLLVGFAFGAWRGTTITLLTRDGVLWQRYTGATLGVWAFSLTVNASIGVLGVHLGVHADARPVQLSIGVSMLGEALTLALRGLSTGYPFAPERVRKTRSAIEPIPVERQRLRAAVTSLRSRSAVAEWQRTGNPRSALNSLRSPDRE
ncbi:hypothetical protein [Nocardia brasiliensis]|uniref:hypothetical protein n=1 Tax=Nocardia brasiliensis TaxID=37326 RepID=UPI00366CC7E2